MAEAKAAAAQRRVAAVNADGPLGQWQLAMARSIAKVREVLDQLTANQGSV